MVPDSDGPLPTAVALCYKKVVENTKKLLAVNSLKATVAVS